MNSNMETVQKVYTAFASGDVPTVLSSLSPNIEWIEAEGFPLGGTYIGPDAVLSGVFMRLATEWEGFAAVPHEFIDAGDTIVVIGKYSGKYGATGKHFSADFAHIWKFRDAKAVSFRQIVDSALVNKALIPV